MLTNFSIGVLLTGISLLGIYFMPAIVAIYREHHCSVSIIVVNVLFGWTLLGWGVAMVWACLPKNKQS